MFKHIPILACAALLFCNCGGRGFTKEERKLIGKDPEAGLMRVLTVNSEEDLNFLRREAGLLNDADIASPWFKVLCHRMLATVTDPSQEGVGIAAPQVGVGRMLIAVQRFDKQGEPFEFYVNPRITIMPDTLVPSPEGCLSVPDRKGTTMRMPFVEIEYNDPATFELKRETVEGFTAIIFQHEIDHLHGRLYTDRLVEIETKEEE